MGLKQRSLQEATVFSQETHEVRPFRRINWHVIEGRYRIKNQETQHEEVQVREIGQEI